MNIYLIPLTNIPQTFVVTVGDQDLDLTFKWNDSQDAGWVMDIADDTTGLPIICGIPLITGADLLDQYDYLGIEGGLVVYTNGDPTAVPTLDNLGTDCNVYVVTT